MHWHVIDDMTVQQQDRRDAGIMQAMHGAECCTDHSLAHINLSLYIQPNFTSPQANSSKG